MSKFISQKPHYEYLRKKWGAKKKQSEENLFDKHLRNITLGSLGGLMLLSTPTMPNTSFDDINNNHKIVVNADTNRNLMMGAELSEKLPQDVRPLTPEEEAQMSQIIQQDTGIKAYAELDGIRLNRSYGMIGGEQHLYRYPGDTLEAHARDAEDWAMYGSSGIAPGLGAWGYFAPSKAEFTKEDEERERYYLAVPTFLSPGFSENVAKYRDFYKYRKMLVVNPETGQAVVAVVGDAGPAEWTGKHLGGSPEVMHELGLAKGSRKGAVLYFFIDDPDNQIKLGPVKLDDQLLARS